MKSVFAVLRLAAAVAIVIAVVAQWVEAMNDPKYFFFNFYGYFTIQSNLLIAVAFAIAAAYGFRRREQPEWVVVVRGATTTYLATTGVVYNLLLANLPAGDFNVPWSNDILHKWIPVFAVLQWILFGDRPPIAWRRLWIFLVYPIVWLIATLVRGRGFVPYPFLDVDQLGAGGVAIYCVAITAFIVGMSALVIWTSRYRILRPEGVDEEVRQERASVSNT
jgi:hypothetical protein